MQQHQTPILFCSECGAANDPADASCIACHEPLVHSPENLSASQPVTPVVIAPSAVREVVASAPAAQASLGVPMDFWPGLVLFGRYQIRREIGRGGFSIVYLAEDLKAKHRLVAIKRIYIRALTSRQMIDATETYNREIGMLSFLKPVAGVPDFYESFTDTENWYLAMEYVGGQTLEEYLQKAPGGYLPESKVAEIGEKLARILLKLHANSRRIIFRDMKPSNIMITQNSDLYLIDFGIARSFKPGKLKDTTPLGSPGYAPPEQYGRAQTDERADIYSLGATMQTLFTGRDPLELAQGELSHNPKEPSPRLRKLLDKMLEPEASKRSLTMRQVWGHLLLMSLSDVRNVWRALLACCVGAGFGALGCELVLLVYNSGLDFPFFLLALLLGVAALYGVAVILWAANLFPFRRYIERLRKKNRSSYTNFAWLGVILGTLVVLLFFNFLIFLWALLYGGIWVVGMVKSIFSS